MLVDLRPPLLYLFLEMRYGAGSGWTDCGSGREASHYAYAIEVYPRGSRRLTSRFHNADSCEHDVHHVPDHTAARCPGRIPSGLDRLGQNSYLAVRSQRKLPSEMPGKSGCGWHTPAASVRICPPAAISENGLCTS